MCLATCELECSVKDAFSKGATPDKTVAAHRKANTSAEQEVVPPVRDVNEGGELLGDDSGGGQGSYMWDHGAGKDSVRRTTNLRCMDQCAASRCSLFLPKHQYANIAGMSHHQQQQNISLVHALLGQFQDFNPPFLPEPRNPHDRDASTAGYPYSSTTESVAESTHGSEEKTNSSSLSHHP